ncbi:MAG: ACT domain-containing protein [Promethearchaeota archaeon]
MAGISDIKTLLKLMKPKMVKKEFVFCTIPKDHFSNLKIAPIMMFAEEEGITIIVKKEIADNNSLTYSETWAWITLTVHSDLSAVGFLATVTNKLAQSGISVNVISAYYHDHLFIPFNKSDQALRVLHELTELNQE